MERHLAGRTREEPGTRVLPAKLEGLRDSIREAVHAVEPGAEIILYGSRARGDAGPESDWDLLILVEGPVDGARKSAIRHRLYEVEWAMDEVLTSIIFNRDDWHSPLYRAMPFHRNVDRDGVSL
jgi:uncharacterized protein